MTGFEFYNPTKVVFENDGYKKVGTLVKEQNAKKVLIVYGGKSAEKSGLIQSTKDILTESEIEYTVLSGVVPNPLLSKVYEGIKLGKEENIDFILAVGGGSVIDTAKAIGVAIACGGEVWDFFDKTRTVTKCLPIGTILTIPAAGSETSFSSVITKDDGMLKRSFGSNYAICKFAIMDPKLTLTLPDYQTACGCVDIMMHTMERYFNTVENMELTDSLSEALLRTVITYAKILVKEPSNMEARWNIMWAGSLSHNGLMNCGNNRGDWATHKIEHELGGMYDVAHGAGLSAIWGAWARYVVEIIPHRFEKFAINVMGVSKEENSLDTAQKGIQEVEKFFEYIKMPINLTQLNVKPTLEEIDEMAIKCTDNMTQTVGTVKQLEKNDIVSIYNAANK